MSLQGKNAIVPTAKFLFTKAADIAIVVTGNSCIYIKNPTIATQMCWKFRSSLQVGEQLYRKGEL